MSAEGEVTMLIIDGSVSRMLEDDQRKFREARERIREAVEDYGLPGLLALAYVACEVDQ
ncbi:ubiquitin family protein [Burkholderia vietnamiensis]|uniref:hypothetical protein n=1 Tax=Burkholderia vietnamiensis TaxID=60552 RepID=UPI001ABAAD1A|nr:hypothetical protein [Burkholderia vietnamiensis]MCA8267423.1 hypothetical protein [Burkholderia vietnamiensis]